MIINCPFCEKKFEIDPSLIPEKGRLLQCGSCEQTWFFDRKQNDYPETIANISDVKKKPITTSPKKNINKRLSIKDKPPSQLFNNQDNKRDFEIVEYKSKSNFTLNKLLSYILVLIISFVGLLIIIDTFKVKLYEIFPKLEILVFSLFETLKDIVLFAKDLL
tara:strand:+ start:138 stop:623 length:486 start_codon:yes stop_codon:yes gene_type:complete